MSISPLWAADENVLYKLLSDILDAVVRTFDDAGIDLPNRRYVSLGAVAADCEQLTVQLDQLYKGTPGGDPGEIQRCNGPRTVACTVQLFRKTAALGSYDSEFPPVPALDSSAQTHLRDIWVMMDASDEIAGTGLQGGIISEASAQEAAGEMVGINMTIAIAVP